MASSFIVKVLKIERYCTDSLSILKTEMAGVTELYDFTVSGKRKKMKCVLHPSINNLVCCGVVQPNNIISIDSFKVMNSDQYDVRIVTDMTVLTDDSKDELVGDHKFFNTNYKTTGPLTTSREYYLSLYNNEECYGNIWTKHQRKMTVFEENAVEKLIDISQLDLNRKSRFPVYGTVITKSRLSHFGKPTDSKHCSPFVFSIEIESGWKTCSVSFWNKSCLAYFKSIKIGQVIVLKNYRVKRRYGNRTNTVYTSSEAIQIELSINSENPTGEVNLINLQPDFIEYRFYTSSMLQTDIYERDFILDITGIITYIGRWEREKKKANWSQQMFTTSDFWMYRWIFLYDGTSAPDETALKIKLYASSQNDVNEKVELGDILVASRVLCKCEVSYTNHRFHRYMYLTSSRETQLFTIKDPYNVTVIEKYPFAKCKLFLNILKNYDTYMEDETVKSSFQCNGFFKFPPIPTQLAFYRCSFELEAPFKLLSVKGVKDLMSRMYIYETTRVNIKGSIFIEELIKEKVQSNGSYVGGTIVVDERMTNKHHEKRSKPSNEMTLEKIQNYLGLKPHSRERREFMRVGIVDMVYKDYLELIFDHELAHTFVENHEKITLKDEFLFVLDVYCYGDKQFEVVANRYFYLKDTDL